MTRRSDGDVRCLRTPAAAAPAWCARHERHDFRRASPGVSLRDNLPATFPSCIPLAIGIEMRTKEDLRRRKWHLLRYLHLLCHKACRSLCVENILWELGSDRKRIRAELFVAIPRLLQISLPYMLSSCILGQRTGG